MGWAAGGLIPGAQFDSLSEIRIEGTERTKMITRDQLTSAVGEAILATPGLTIEQADALAAVARTTQAVAVGLAVSHITGVGCPLHQAGLWNNPDLPEPAQVHFYCAFDRLAGSYGTHTVVDA